MEENYENNTHDQGERGDFIDIDKPVEVTAYVGEREVTACFPPETDELFQRELRELLSARFKVHGRRVKDMSQAASLRFFDRTCLDIRGLGRGGQAINRHTPGWKNLVPVRLKVSFSMYFQETQVSGEEELDRD